MRQCCTFTVPSCPYNGKRRKNIMNTQKWRKILETEEKKILATDFHLTTPLKKLHHIKRIGLRFPIIEEQISNDKAVQESFHQRIHLFDKGPHLRMKSRQPTGSAVHLRPWTHKVEKSQQRTWTRGVLSGEVIARVCGVSGQRRGNISLGNTASETLLT